MIQVVFKMRNFGGFPADIAHNGFEVVSYSWSMLGGPYRATIRRQDDDNRWEVGKLLRCPVEIYVDDVLTWWGYVSKVTIPFGSMQVGLGLDDMYNYITVSYPLLNAGATQATTASATTSASDALSISEFGRRENILRGDDMDSTAANSLRDMFLSTHRYPVASVAPGESKEITIECCGWYETLNWKYYSNAATTATDTTAQMASIISASEFISGTDIINTSGITKNQYADGTRRGGDVFSALLEMGTSGSGRLAATVTRDRRIIIEQVSSQLVYIASDGKLSTGLGMVIPPEFCTVGETARMKNAPAVAGGYSNIPDFVIGRAEYSASTGKTVYTPADAAKIFGVTDIQT